MGDKQNTEQQNQTTLEYSQLTLNQAAATFLRVGLLGKSKQTKRWYETRLRQVVTDLGPDKLADLVMEIDLLEWLAFQEMKEEKYGKDGSRPIERGTLSPFTIAGYYRAIRRFFKWLFEKKMISSNPAADIKIPRPPKTGRYGISDENAQLIIDKAKGEIRDYAILQFLRATGCRLGGVADLRLSDLHLDSPVEKLRYRVTVREKGNIERTVFLDLDAWKALKTWVTVRPKVKSDHVFLGYGKNAKFKPLKARGIEAIVEQYAKLAKVTEAHSPHQWRHSFARRMAEDGMNLGILSQILGHSDVKVTVDYYGQFAVDPLQEAYNKHQAFKTKKQ